MSETRYDWLADRWVIFAPHRSQRPDDFATAHRSLPPSQVNCPFCFGRENQTPPEVLRLPRGSSLRQPWQVRVVPNKYPALASLSEPDFRHPVDVHEEPLALDYDSLQFLRGGLATAVQSKSSILFHRHELRGAHEVIIESPEHLSSLTELSEPHAFLVFEAIRRRLIHWRAHDSLHYAVVFKNMGPEAGASLSHSHTQLIATNFVPPDVQRACQRKYEYLEMHQKSFFEEMIAHELLARERIVLQSPHFVAIAPFASQLPYFMVVLPRIQQARFEEIGDRMLAEFARVVRRLLRALETLFPGVAYNFVLHTSPFDARWERAFHWRMEIFPRLTKVAGFEWGSDCFINPVLPEVAARELGQWA